MTISPAIITVFLLVLVFAAFRPFHVLEHQRAVLYRAGRFRRIAGPGLHVRFTPTTNATLVDIRRRTVTVPAQELLTADGIGLKATLVLEFEIVDPYAATSTVQDVEHSLYVASQLALRDVVVARTLEQVMAERASFGPLLLDGVTGAASVVGVQAHRVEVKDLMLPGDLKRIFGQVAEAKQEGIASLERARAQSAVVRNLANAARMLEDNPGVLQLRIVDAMSQTTGNTFIVGELPEVVRRTSS